MQKGTRVEIESSRDGESDCRYSWDRAE